MPPLVEWYLDETGNQEKIGVVQLGGLLFTMVISYLLIVKNISKENYPDAVWINNPVTGERTYVPPKRFTYIFFNVFDNPALLKTQPSVCIRTSKLTEHERDSQLWGNWYSRAKTESLWQRQWIRGEDGERVKKRKVPFKTVKVRGVDKAHTLPSDTNKYPDYTAFSPE